MAQCKHCGHSVGDREAFCATCGRKLEPVRTENGSAWQWPVAAASFIIILVLIGQMTNSVPTSAPPLDAKTEPQSVFDKMSDAEHLRQAQSALNPSATIAQIDVGLTHVGAIQSSSTEAGNAKALDLKLEAARKRAEQTAAKAAASQARAQAIADAATKRLMRDAMAKLLENNLLGEGFNVDVVAIGADHTVLHIKWVLVSKVLAYQLSQQGDFFQNARDAGFKKVEITDGFDQAWYWKLN